MLDSARDLRAIPAVRGLPIVGQTLDLRFRRLKAFADAAAVGPMARIRLGATDILVVTDPGLAHQVLVDQADAFTKSRTLHRSARGLLGDGLLTSEHDVHRRQRKLLAGLFSPRMVATWADQMVVECERMLSTWSDGDTVNVPDEMRKLTLSIVGRTLFDLDVSADAEWVGRALTEANVQAATESTRLVSLPARIPTPGRLRARRHLRQLDEFVYTLIAERRRTGSQAGDVLSLLVAARDEETGRTLTDVEIRDEVMTLFFAGHETTASLLAWTWPMIDAIPGVRGALEAELESVLRDQPPTFADLQRLPVAGQILDETMRLRPPVYGIPRIAERDVAIGGVRIPRGATVVVNVLGIHRMPELFAEPERFDIERMTAANRAALPKLAYMPFGSGPRVCIGAHFAVMEAQLLVSTIAQRVRLHGLAAREPGPWPMITLRPKPFRMRIAVRS